MWKEGEDLEIHVFDDEAVARTCAAAHPSIEIQEGGIECLKPAHVRRVTRHVTLTRKEG